MDSIKYAGGGTGFEKRTDCSSGQEEEEERIRADVSIFVCGGGKTRVLPRRKGG